MYVEWRIRNTKQKRPAEIELKQNKGGIERKRVRGVQERHGSVEKEKSALYR